MRKLTKINVYAALRRAGLVGVELDRVFHFTTNPDRITAAGRAAGEPSYAACLYRAGVNHPKGGE